MNNALERLRQSITNLECINEVLEENEEYNDHLEKLENQLDNLDGRFLDMIYPPIGEKSGNRNMALSDLVQYMILGRGYYEVTSRRSERTKNRSYNNLYKIILRFINLLYLQDSILTQEENHELREELVDKLNDKIGDGSSSYYEDIKEWEYFLHQPWGHRNVDDNKKRKKIYKKLDQLLPKVRGNPNELITYVHLIRKRIGYIIPLLTHQRIIGATIKLDDNKMIDMLTPPDLLILRENKEIYGVEIGRGSDRQINKFTKNTGIPVITADTNKISNHRCPFCMKWTLFCPFVIEKGMNKDYTNKNEIECSNCDIDGTNNGEDCIYSLIEIKIPEFYNGKAHYHFKCVQNYYESNDEEFNPDEHEIFTYFPFVKGLKTLENK